MTGPSIDDLLAIADPFKRVDAIHCRLAEVCYVMALDPPPEVERVVGLTYQAGGVIGNGGFEYLFSVARPPRFWIRRRAPPPP